MSSGEEWKKDKVPDFKISTLYMLETSHLERIIQKNTQENWTKAVLEEVLLYKPTGTYKPQWIDSIDNEIIRAWINSDPVFRKLEGNPPMNHYQRRIHALRAGLDYALMWGEWTKELIREAASIERATEKQEDDGA